MYNKLSMVINHNSVLSILVKATDNKHNVNIHVHDLCSRYLYPWSRNNSDLRSENRGVCFAQSYINLNKMVARGTWVVIRISVNLICFYTNEGPIDSIMILHVFGNSKGIRRCHQSKQLFGVPKEMHLFISVGKTSNFAVVMATLYINGKNHGMHGFLVQLRSLETHEPMPGTLHYVYYTLTRNLYISIL